MIDLDELFGAGVFGHPAKYPSLISLLRGHCLGRLRLESGRVAVADPYLLDDAIELGRECPRGSFPVFAGASEMYEGHDVTGLCVRFADRAVAEWEPVFAGGRGVPVDSASLAVCDAARAASLKEVALQTDFRRRPVGGALFASGEGAACSVGSDGGYPVYFGLDARGEVVRLAVTAVAGDFVHWERDDLPRLSKLDEVATWVAKVQGKDRSFVFGETPPSLVRELERMARRWAPPELREYYRLMRPWDDDLLPLWRKWATPGALPLSLCESGGHALTPDGAVRGIDERGLLGQALDIPSWLVLYAITLYDLAC